MRLVYMGSYMTYLVSINPCTCHLCCVYCVVVSVSSKDMNDRGVKMEYGQKSKKKMCNITYYTNLKQKRKKKSEATINTVAVTSVVSKAVNNPKER